MIYISDYMYLEKGQKSFLSYTEVDRNKVIDYVTDGNTIWKASNFPDGRLKSDYAACDIVSIYKRLKLNHGAATHNEIFRKQSRNHNKGE